MIKVNINKKTGTAGVYDDGVLISKGESAQHMAFARNILRNKSLYIKDESWNGSTQILTLEEYPKG